MPDTILPAIDFVITSEVDPPLAPFIIYTDPRHCITVKARPLSAYLVNGSICILVQPLAIWSVEKWHDMPADCPFEISADMLVGQV